MSYLLADLDSAQAVLVDPSGGDVPLLRAEFAALDARPFPPRQADPRALWDSVTQRLFGLPDETLLFAGHARQGRMASTVFEQRRRHPWFGRAGRAAGLISTFPTP